MPATLSGEVKRVLRRVRACEFSTLARTGRPVTWPMAFLWKPEENEFVLSSSISVARKAEHINRDDRVSLLMSDFTGSALPGSAPAVLVQGRATAPEEIMTVDGLEDFWAELFRKRPAGALEALDPRIRAQFHPSFYWRLRITVTPEKVWAFRKDAMGGTALERVA
uniref:Pyridoxamine 5'-phosphate oxidase-related protein n=1 Tax=Streptomyces lavendulae TaxID=1914 RepID=B0CN20_STRLA|nr:pyridoxamine 5'-phosphate oxidase-related protein [Streptomyces lavendulae]